MELAHDHGVKVAALVGTVPQAERQVQNGVDIIVASGYEAGGHTGEITTMVLVPEIVAVHELGHQWFYGLVATNEAAWPFLDEGLNQFAETDAMAKWQGPGSAARIGGLQVQLSMAIPAAFARPV